MSMLAVLAVNVMATAPMWGRPGYGGLWSGPEVGDKVPRGRKLLGIQAVLAREEPAKG